MQGNEGVRPYFRKWLGAFVEDGAQTLTLRNTGGTDHLPFDAIGLPGFQFIQDPIEYEGGFFATHHTDMDVYDRLQRDDLMQAAVVIATFAYQAANRDELLPRKPLPPVAPAAPELKGVKKGDATKATPHKPAEAAPGAR
jgi:carboxypeptidase Q